MATREGLLIAYRALKLDMKGLPPGNPVRVKLRKQMSDIIQQINEMAARGEIKPVNKFK